MSAAAAVTASGARAAAGERAKSRRRLRLLAAASVCFAAGSANVVAVAAWAAPRWLAERARPAPVPVLVPVPAPAAAPARPAAPDPETVAEPALEREPAPVPEPAPAPEPVAEPGSAASAPSPVLALASAPAVAPVIVPEVPDRGPFLLLYPSGSARWEDGGKTVLASLIERMRDRQDVVLVIEGHTDSRGEPGVNDRLSHRRAEGVAAVFRAAGFPSARILVRAYGATRPRVTSGDLGALRLNRRVEINLRGGK